MRDTRTSNIKRKNTVTVISVRIPSVVWNDALRSFIMLPLRPQKVAAMIANTLRMPSFKLARPRNMLKNPYRESVNC
jgi:hypothetical protein